MPVRVSVRPGPVGMSNDAKPGSFVGSRHSQAHAKQLLKCFVGKVKCCSGPLIRGPSLCFQVASLSGVVLGRISLWPGLGSRFVKKVANGPASSVRFFKLTLLSWPDLAYPIKQEDLAL